MKMSSKDILKQYVDYYKDGANDAKRSIAAKEQLLHLDNLVGDRIFRSLIDVGAGQGAFVGALAELGRAHRIVAAEISSSGLAAIVGRKKDNIEAVEFDGYRLPFQDKEFEIATCMHVLEHVESERLFLREMARVSRIAVIEVPLEHTIRIGAAIDVGKEFGHINYYSVNTFLNILCTSDLIVKRHIVSAASLEMERYLYGRYIGIAKRLIRNGMLSIIPSIAPALMVYTCTALVECGD